MIENKGYPLQVVTDFNAAALRAALWREAHAA